MIELDADQKTPLYEQLYAALAEDIRTGQRAPGTPLCRGGAPWLPSMASASTRWTLPTRCLPRKGWPSPRPRSGFYVQKPTACCTAAPAAHPPPRTAAARRDAAGLYDLSTGSVDTALFPARSWGRIQKELLYQRPELLQRGEMQGDAPAGADRGLFVGVPRRGLHSRSRSSSARALSICWAAWRTCSATAWRPSKTPATSARGRSCKTAAFPARWWTLTARACRRALEKSGANLCYLTPSHHFPTGVTMPATRRAQLLAWAAAQPGRYILEDDYDSEFRFDTRPLPSLQGMSGPDGPVVYLTTFSKSLAPGIRIACMVLPQSLLARYRRDFATYANTVSRFEQQTLCEFMAGGYLHRHLARMRLA